MPTEFAETSAASEVLKSAILRASDLALLARAHEYDVESPEDRARSTSDLARLFFHASNALGVDLLIEAGAKDAATSRRARRYLSLRRIVAFEANPYTYERFAAENADAQFGMEYLHLALSDRPGSITFNVLRNDNGAPRADGQGSILKRQNEIDKGFTEVAVDATTLDDFFRDDECERAALWVDVEGATKLVLTGGTELLEQRAAIALIEVEDRGYWGDEQWLRQDVMSFMHDRGFSAVARDFQSRYQYNILFVRSDLLDVDRFRWALTLFNSASPRLRNAKRANTATASAETSQASGAQTSSAKASSSQTSGAKPAQPRAAAPTTARSLVRRLVARARRLR